MSQMFTRPLFRDWIRRLLQITPPFDVGAGPIGAQPSWAATPTNSQINDRLQDALSRINTYCGSHITQISKSVSAQTANGPLGIYLEDLTNSTDNASGQVVPIGLINDIQRVLWTVSGGTPYLLQPTMRDTLDRLQSTYYLVPPSSPVQWYVEGGVLYITPAPSQAGAFTLTCGTGFLGLQTETDVIDQLSIDFQIYVGYEALVLLSLETTMDVEARERAANFLPLAEDGKRLIKAWKEGLSGTPQPSLAFRTYRNSYGTMRVRR